MTSAKTKAGISPVPLDPPVGRVTLTGYIEMVADYWADDGGAGGCQYCDMLIDDGYCAMLHDHSIPDGNCFGLFERDGVEQPKEVTPNAELRGGDSRPA